MKEDGRLRHWRHPQFHFPTARCDTCALIHQALPMLWSLDLPSCNATTSGLCIGCRRIRPRSHLYGKPTVALAAASSLFH